MNHSNEKKPKEHNEIANKELKEQIDYQDLINTKVVFGYLFDIEGHGIEALLKVITDKTTAYFAVQGESLLRLNFSEELFQGTTETFLILHG